MPDLTLPSGEVIKGDPNYPAPMLDGQNILVAPSMPLWNVAGGSAMTAGVLRASRLVPYKTFRVSKVRFVVSGAGASDDEVHVVIMNATGVVIARTAGSLGLTNTTGVKELSLVAPVSLARGVVYFVGVVVPTVAVSAATVVCAATGTLGLVARAFGDAVPAVMPELVSAELTGVVAPPPSPMVLVPTTGLGAPLFILVP